VILLNHLCFAFDICKFRCCVIQTVFFPGAKLSQYPPQKHLLCCIANQLNECLWVNTSSMTDAHLAHRFHRGAGLLAFWSALFVATTASDFLGLGNQILRNPSMVIFFFFRCSMLHSSSSTSRMLKSAKNSFGRSISPRILSNRPSLRKIPTMTDLKESGMAT